MKSDYEREMLRFLASKHVPAYKSQSAPQSYFMIKRSIYIPLFEWLLLTVNHSFF